MENQKVISYEDLDVYKGAYNSSISVMQRIILKLPPNEKYDLSDQLSRACKSIPRLIAEGFAKKYQRAGYQKYLTDMIGESNEMQVSLSQVRDLYSRYIDLELTIFLINEYKIISKQLFKLGQSWSKFTKPKI